MHITLKSATDSVLKPATVPLEIGRVVAKQRSGSLKRSSFLSCLSNIFCLIRTASLLNPASAVSAGINLSILFYRDYAAAGRIWRPQWSVPYIGMPLLGRALAGNNHVAGPAPVLDNLQEVSPGGVRQGRYQEVVDYHEPVFAVFPHQMQMRSVGGNPIKHR
ncbi:MAG: hypothetical protein NTX59_13205 [Elusimicrobia bacterium]|nr:hypothetical protein [Elusimicrobiota bacterium]